MNRRRRIGTAVVCVVAFAAALCAQAQQQSGYLYTPPPGWTQSADSGVQVLVPGDAPAGSAQVMLMPLKPLDSNFSAQFDSEKASLELQWGLRAAQPVSPQKGSTAAGPYAAYFASYASDNGPRYMSFLAIGRQGKFAMVVLVAATDVTFNQLAPQVTQFWQSLQLAP